MSGLKRFVEFILRPVGGNRYRANTTDTFSIPPTLKARLINESHAASEELA